MALDPKNYINVGPHGTFRESGDLHTKPADVDSLIEHLVEKDIDHLVLHFHGGLNSEKRGVEVAEALLPIYSTTGYHPVFFIWETGLLETARRNLGSIHKTKLFQKLATLVLRFAAGKLGVDVDSKGAGDALTPEDVARELGGKMFREFDATARGGAAALQDEDLDVLEQELAAELEVELEDDAELDQAIAEARQAGASPDADVLKNLDDDDAKGIGTMVSLAATVAKIVAAVVKRYLDKRDHGFYPTVVEELLRTAYVANLGNWLWGGMKVVAEDMWKSNDGIGDAENQHAGRYFLEKVSALQKKRKEAGGKLVVKLVGHSAGSIAICHMLAAAAESAALEIENVAFLAPAARADLFVKEMVDHPDRFGSLRVFTMRDDLESEDQLLKGVYTRSLLYFISGVLETEKDAPIVGMERYYSGESPYDEGNVKKMTGFLTADGKRVALSKTGAGAPEGQRTQAVTHGGFDDDPTTRESLRYLLLNE